MLTVTSGAVKVGLTVDKELNVNPAGAVHIVANTGTGSGSYITFPPMASSLPSTAGAIQVTISESSSANFQVYLAETGDGPCNASSFLGKNGADGEWYISPVLPTTLSSALAAWSVSIAISGTGTSVQSTVPSNSPTILTIPVWLGDFTKRTTWGNQNGNSRIDIPGLKAVQLRFPGGQGQVSVDVYGIDWIP